MGSNLSPMVILSPNGTLRDFPLNFNIGHISEKRGNSTNEWHGCDDLDSCEDQKLWPFSKTTAGYIVRCISPGRRTRAIHYSNFLFCPEI
ncbi:unnamed protein product [Allacma fusca]|uniref:Uncharacterized protein n=1 Tax=Allacma fusca TaxID=39272 RepID=A0A8J2P119_9HEXA|nr:unnamed protein product [Allacma fusca]